MQQLLKLFDRISRLNQIALDANPINWARLSDLIQQSVELEQLLEYEIEQMEADWIEARQALIQVEKLTVQLVPEPISIKILRRNLTLLKDQISEARTMRTQLKAQIATVQAQRHIQAAYLAELDRERQFDQFEFNGDVDGHELARMKALLGDALSQAQLPSTATNILSNAAVDLELEALKSELDQL